MLAISLIVRRKAIARANLVAALVGTSDLKAIELVDDNSGLIKVLVGVNGEPVVGADGLMLERAMYAIGAEGVAAFSGGERQVEGRVADGAHQGAIDLLCVLESLVIERQDVVGLWRARFRAGVSRRPRPQRSSRCC